MREYCMRLRTMVEDGKTEAEIEAAIDGYVEEVSSYSNYFLLYHFNYIPAISGDVFYNCKSKWLLNQKCCYEEMRLQFISLCSSDMAI